MKTTQGIFCEIGSRSAVLGYDTMLGRLLFLKETR